MSSDASRSVKVALDVTGTGVGVNVEPVPVKRREFRHAQNDLESRQARITGVSVASDEGPLFKSARTYLIVTSASIY
jgi:hypothetical protein